MANPEYARVPVGDSTEVDGVNLLIAAVFGDFVKMREVSSEYLPGDKRLTDLLATVVVVASMALRHAHPDDREDLLNHVRGIAKKEYIAKRAGITTEPTLANYAGFY